MKKGEWTFFSNHGHVLLYLARHTQSTTQEIAYQTNLSIAGVQNIIKDLEESGYINRSKVGRGSRYTVHGNLQLRHHLEQNHNVSCVLSALGYDRSEERIVK